MEPIHPKLVGTIKIEIGIGKKIGTMRLPMFYQCRLVLPSKILTVAAKRLEQLAALARYIPAIFWIPVEPKTDVLISKNTVESKPYQKMLILL